MNSVALKLVAGGCLMGLAGCMTVSEGFVWGDNSSQWANDGDCDDPRFDGPWAHSVLLPQDVMRDANDCQALYNDGKVYLRANYRAGVTYDNPGYAGAN
ncbi:MAG: hypothetical protein ABF254_01695 [Octadecabacter sp.]